MAAIISGKVFNDANHNGIYDSGENGIANVYVTLYSSINQSCVSTQTDSSGNYSFSISQTGNYSVYETVTNINSSCPPVNFTQPDGFTMSNGPRKFSLAITQTQINNNTTIGNNNFSHDTIDNELECTASFIQFAGNPTNWYNINVVTGIPEIKTTLSPANYVNAIGYNILDNYIYGYDQTTGSIVRVDNSGNIMTLKPNPNGLPLGNYNTGTLDPNGFLYIFVNDGTRFYTIDLRPNSSTFMKLVNPTNGYLEQTSNYGVALNPAVNVSDWVYNKTDGNLYGVTSTGILARIVPTTGGTSNLITTGATNGPFGAQAIDAHGNIYAISNRDGNIYKYTISGNTANGILFSNTVVTSNNDGTMCPNAAVNIDFGDAPDVSSTNGPNDYNTLLANNGPRHQIRNGLYLGHLITGENDAYQNADATGDDLLLDVQDDSLTTPLTPISTPASTYSLAVEVTNNTGEDANLYGWIDFNQNGLFEESEAVTAVVPSIGLQTINLTFNVPGGGAVIGGHTFVRLRLTTDNLTNSGTNIQDDRSVGPASDGEVEDYILRSAAAADLSVTKTADPIPVLAGKELMYTINVTNNGPDIAYNVEILDTLPVDLSDMMFSTDGGATWNPWEETYLIGDMINGQNITILIRGIVNSSVLGIITNTVTVTSTTPDPNPDNNTATVDVPVILVADISVVKIGNPNPIHNGEELTYTIVISNAGPSDAEDVVVKDVIPQELNNVEYSLNNGGTWNPWSDNLSLGHLQPGVSIILLIRGIVNSSAVGTIINTVDVTSPTPDPNPGDNTDTTEIPIISIADLELTKTADSYIVNQGQLLTYSIQIINHGPSDAENVILEDIVPAAILNPEYSIDGTDFFPWNSPLNLNNLFAGSITNVYIRGIIGPDTSGTIINTATVISNTFDPNPDNNTDTIIVNVNDAADLAVNKIGSPNPVNNGEVLTYTVNVTNNGPNTAENIVLTDDIPESILNAEYSLDGGTTFNPWISPLNIGNLVPNTNKEILIRGTVNSIPDTAIENTVTVMSDTPDPDLSNNTDTFINGVNDLADLSITKTGDPKPVIAGELITYTLVVTNAGPSIAENVILTDNLSQDILNAEYSLDGGTTFNSWISPLNIGNLAPNTNKEILIRGTVNSGVLNSTLSNVTTVTSDIPDPDPSNNIDTEEIPIMVEADLSVTKIGTPNSVIAGETLNYSILVTNNGPSDANDVTLVDAIPSNIENPEYSIDGGITYLPWVNPYSIGHLPATNNFNILIRGTVSHATLNDILNTVVVTSTTRDPDLSNNIDRVTTEVITSADISITKTALTNPVMTGDIVVYSLLVNNAGPNTSSAIDIYDIVPPDINSPEYSLNGGVTWIPLTSPINIGDLAKGQSINILVRGILSETENIVISNSALIVSPTPDPDLSNNRDDEAVIISPNVADLSIKKTGPSIVAPGGTISYVLTVTNNGPSAALNVLVTDLLSSEISNSKYSIDNGVTFNLWPGRLNIGTLTNGESREILLSGFINADQCYFSITNTATVTSDTPDLDSNNNTSTFISSVISCETPNICKKSKMRYRS